MEGQIKFVNILGEIWRVEYRTLTRSDEDGYTDPENKTIVIRSDNVEGFDNFESAQRRWLRHEVIHAFHFECGLGFNYQHKPMGIDETETDWFAYQYPRLKKAFIELGCDEEV